MAVQKYATVITLTDGERRALVIMPRTRCCPTLRRSLGSGKIASNQLRSRHQCLAGWTMPERTRVNCDRPADVGEAARSIFFQSFGVTTWSR